MDIQINRRISEEHRHLHLNHAGGFILFTLYFILFSNALWVRTTFERMGMSTHHFIRLHDYSQAWYNEGTEMWYCSHLLSWVIWVWAGLVNQFTHTTNTAQNQLIGISTTKLECMTSHLYGLQFRQIYSKNGMQETTLKHNTRAKQKTTPAAHNRS